MSGGAWMDRFTGRFAIFVLCAAILPAGCQPPDGGGGGGELTEAQKAAVNEVHERFAALPAALSALGSLEKMRDPTDVPDETGTFGDCPELSFARNGTIYSIGVDFGDGCSNGVWDSTYSGAATGSYDTNTHTFTLAFDHLTVDDESIDGFASLSFELTALGGQWTLDVDLASGDGVAIEGTVVVRYNTQAGTITIPNADLNLSEDGDEFAIVAAGLVIDWKTYGNAIPSAGTITFVLDNEDDSGPDTVTIVVTFDANSPVDGTVQVKVGTEDAVEHTLPGF